MLQVRTYWIIELEAIAALENVRIHLRRLKVHNIMLYNMFAHLIKYKCRAWKLLP